MMGLLRRKNTTKNCVTDLQEGMTKNGLTEKFNQLGIEE